ncbi:MAG: hypothetical protein Q9171_000786 [Xanthocarpia ochracea]
MQKFVQGRSAYEPFDNEEASANSAPQKESSTELSNQQTDVEDTPQIAPHSRRPGPYVQRYDDHGCPQNLRSHVLSRRSRRAQNDVLATVGVLLGPDQLVQEPRTPHVQRQRGTPSVEMNRDIDYESDLGDQIYTAYLALDGFSHGRMRCARQRLQTFRFYTGVPLRRILSTEWRSLGSSLFFWGSLPGDLLTFQMFQHTVYDYARLATEDYLARMLPRTRSVRLNRLLIFGDSIIKHCLRVVHWSIVGPFRFHSVLQGLGLRPLWPIFPGLIDFVPSTAGSLLRPIHLPTSLTFKSGIGYLAAVATSPLALLYLSDILHYAIGLKVFTYIRLALPRPDNPDPLSNSCAALRGENVPGHDTVVEAEYAKTVPGLDIIAEGVYARNIPTIQGQAKKDWAAFSNYLKTLTSWWGSFIVRNQTSDSSVSVPRNSRLSGGALVAEMSLGYANYGHEDNLAEHPDDAEVVFLGSVLGPPSSEPASGAACSERDTNPRPSRSGSRDWQANLEGSELGITPPRCQCKPKNLSKPTYRVTGLTTLMAETLATSLSTIVADVLLLPLEALFVRSVALAHLDTAGGAAYSAMGLRNEIYPLGSWFGTGLRGGRPIDYVREMVLCFGVDMLLGFLAWQTTAGAVWWVVKRQFTWGSR